MEKLKIAWWLLGIVFFFDTVRKEGFVRGMINWINPLTPP